MDFTRLENRGPAVLLLLLVVLILWTVGDYGITSDEPLHVENGEAILKWYTSGFGDHSVFESKNTWLYGGLFDAGVAIASRLLPISTYDARHLCNALVGLLGLMAAYRIGCLLGGQRAGLLAALFLVLTPRYYGHAFNNPKDMPFAVAYLWGLYYLLQCLKAYPNLPRTLMLKTGLALGSALAVRVGGLLLFFYAVLFLFLAWIRISNRSVSKLPQILYKIAAIFLIAYGVAFLFWPWLQIHPITGIYQALQTFNAFPEIHYTFFEGIYIGSDQTPWYYAPKWMMLTLPEHVLFGLCAGATIVLVKRRLPLCYGVMIFSAIFPIGYAMATRMPLYDGIRHLLFVMPPLAILAALGIHQTLQTSPKIAYPTLGLCALLMLLTIRDLIVLHPNQYVYFNRLFGGGTAQAARRYDTDYWENSYRQGIQWLETHAAKPGVKPKVRAHYAHAKLMLDSNRFQWVHLPDEADFYMASTRYERHKLIPGDILHTVRADGADLLYIVRPDSAHARDPFFLNAPYKFAFLGDFYSDIGDRKRAMMSYAMAIDQRVDTLVTAQRMWGYFHALAQLFIESGGLKEARDVVQKAIHFNPDQAEAWYLLAQIYARENNPNKALPAIQEALKRFPNRQTYQTAYTNLGVLYQQLGQIEKAQSIYHRALQWNPDNAEVLINLGIIYFARNRFEESIAAFQRATSLKPDDIEALLGLAQAYERAKRTGDALSIYRKILLFVPDSEMAKDALDRLSEEAPVQTR